MIVTRNEMQTEYYLDLHRARFRITGWRVNEEYGTVMLFYKFGEEVAPVGLLEEYQAEDFLRQVRKLERNNGAL